MMENPCPMAALREATLLMGVKRSHNLKVVSSNLARATNKPLKSQDDFESFSFDAAKK